MDTWPDNPAGVIGRIATDVPKGASVDIDLSEGSLVQGHLAPDVRGWAESSFDIPTGPM